MKLILNNRTNEAIIIDNFSRNLDIPDSSILFDISFSSYNLANASSMNYIIQYAEAPITSYKLLSDEDEEILEVTNIEATLTSFNENFSNGYYNANANIQEKA